MSNRSKYGICVNYFLQGNSKNQVRNEGFKINGFYIKSKKYELNYAISPDFTFPFTTNLNFIYGESESGNYYWKKEDFVYLLQDIIKKIDINHSADTILKNLEFYVQTNVTALIYVKPDSNFNKHIISDLSSK